MGMKGTRGVAKIDINLGTEEEPQWKTVEALYGIDLAERKGLKRVVMRARRTIGKWLRKLVKKVEPGITFKATVNAEHFQKQLDALMQRCGGEMGAKK